MKAPERVEQVGELQITEDVGAQRRAWRMQGWGQLAVLLFVVAGAFGVFGGGLLGDGTASDPTGRVRLQYARFARLESPAALRFVIAPELVHQGEITLWIEAPYMHANAVQNVSPRPAREETAGERIVYHFAASEAGAPVAVVFRLKPQSVGRRSGRAGVSDGAEVSFADFVYP